MNAFIDKLKAHLENMPVSATLYNKMRENVVFMDDALYIPTNGQSLDIRMTEETEETHESALLALHVVCGFSRLQLRHMCGLLPESMLTQLLNFGEECAASAIYTDMGYLAHYTNSVIDIMHNVADSLLDLVVTMKKDPLEYTVETSISNDTWEYATKTEIELKLLSSILLESKVRTKIYTQEEAFQIMNAILMHLFYCENTVALGLYIFAYCSVDRYRTLQGKNPDWASRYLISVEEDSGLVTFEQYQRWQISMQSGGDA